MTVPVRADAGTAAPSHVETPVGATPLDARRAPPAEDGLALLSPLAPLLARALGQLAASRTRTHHGGQHLPSCPRGYWINGYSAPDGAPCSKRCAEVGRLLAEAASYGVQPAAAQR